MFKGHDLREVGEKLKVKTVLEGSVRKAGNRLRVNAQLINTDEGYHLWSERYDRTLDDIFEVQDEIARTVVEKLQVKLLGNRDVPVIKRPTDNLEAYSLYLKGRHYSVQGKGPRSRRALTVFGRLWQSSLRLPKPTPSSVRSTPLRHSSASRRLTR